MTDVPPYLARVEHCNFRDGEHCNHGMNATRMCQDSKYCLVAILREATGEGFIKPCGKRTGEACGNADYEGCGSPYCVHFIESNDDAV